MFKNVNTPQKKREAANVQSQNLPENIRLTPDTEAGPAGGQAGAGGGCLLWVVEGGFCS